MGEIADAIVNGFYCQECGQYIDGEEPGYPRFCDDCSVAEVGRKIIKSAKEKKDNSR